MKKKLLFAFEFILVTIILLGVTVFASSVGSSDDPLVAKSYVDDKLEQLTKTINELKNTDSGNASNTSTKYVPVYVEFGQTIFGGEGTEIILRSGKAKTVINGVEGIVNATTGQEFKKDMPITKNNVMIIPRNDGRGFLVTESAWFIVKGSYEIK